MKRNSLQILVLLVSCLCASAEAERLRSPFFKIAQLDGFSNTAGGVVTADRSINPACGISPGNPGAGFRIMTGKSGTSIDGVKMGMSLLLAAFMSGKEVSVDYDDATSACYIYLVRVR